jgi:Secretion system C-terminal sorting domain
VYQSFLNQNEGKPVGFYIFSRQSEGSSQLLNIQPNPFSSQVSISFKPSTKQVLADELFVYDLLGRVVFTQRVHGQESPLSINLSNLHDGQFVLKLKFTDQSHAIYQISKIK